MMLLAVASMAVVSPAAAEGARMRRPRGERPADGARVRGERGERGERPADPPRMRDGMYGGEAGAYGDMDMDMDMDMTCSTSLLDAVAATPDLSTLGTAVVVSPRTTCNTDTPCPHS